MLDLGQGLDRLFLISGRREVFSLFFLVWVLLAGATRGEEIVFRSQRLLPGLEWIYWDGASACRSGDTGIGVLAADPERFRFEVLHYADYKAHQPLTILEWLERVNPTALFNAGQYYPDYSYMGLLIHEGRLIRGRLHPVFQALFVAEPVNQGAPRARIVDLAKERFEPKERAYLEAAQSFMLLDRSGSLRVQRSQNVANRTVVAEGHDGRIWVFVTRGGYTLWELGELLRSSPFPVTQAMSMDGGEEAQLLVKVGDFYYDSMGTWDPKAGRGQLGPRVRIPLPTVVGIFPRGP